MRYYFAAGGNHKDLLSLITLGGKRILLSYFDLQKKPEHVRPALGLDLFIDSGAFSAKTRNITINIDTYINYLRTISPTVYAVLDVIGDPSATWKNLKIMESAGLNPLPVFHLGSDNEWLDKILNAYDRFAIGGLVPHARRQVFLMQHLDAYWERIVRHRSGDRTKLPAVHAFGMASRWLLERYPFASADSTSWFAMRQFGPKAARSKAHERLSQYLHATASYGMFRYEVQHYQQMEKEVTRLWETRGVKWPR